MEIEQTAPVMAKKLYGIIRAILYMVKKGLSKNIPWFEFHMMLKKSTKIAGKAIGNLLLEHHSLSCRRNNIRTTFISPREYEFSCSNTPLFYPKRNKKSGRYFKDSELNVGDVKRVFDFLNSYEVSPEKSPLTLLGFGGGENVRQLRVTDSPFPVDYREEEDAIQVDKKAEEFIKNFYNDLKQQKKRAAVQSPSPFTSPSPYHRWRLVR